MVFFYLTLFLPIHCASPALCDVMSVVPSSLFIPPGCLVCPPNLFQRLISICLPISRSHLSHDRVFCLPTLSFASYHGKGVYLSIISRLSLAGVSVCQPCSYTDKCIMSGCLSFHLLPLISIWQDVCLSIFSLPLCIARCHFYHPLSSTYMAKLYLYLVFPPSLFHDARQSVRLLTFC